LYAIIDLAAQPQGQGSVSGIIMEKTSDKPLEFANVIIKNISDSSKFQGPSQVTGGNLLLINFLLALTKLSTASLVSIKLNPLYLPEFKTE